MGWPGWLSGSGSILWLCAHFVGLYAVFHKHWSTINGHMGNALNSPWINYQDPLVVQHKPVEGDLANQWANTAFDSHLFGQRGIYFHFNRDEYLDAVANKGYGNRWSQWLLPMLNATIDLKCCNTFITNVVLITPGPKQKRVSGWHIDNRLIFRPLLLPKTSPTKVTLLYAHTPRGMQGGRLFVSMPHTKQVETIYPFSGKVVSIRGDTLHAIEAFQIHPERLNEKGSPYLYPDRWHYRITFVLEQHRLPEESLKYMPKGFVCNPSLFEQIHWAGMATISMFLGDGRADPIVLISVFLLPSLVALGIYFSVIYWKFGIREALCVILSVCVAVLLEFLAEDLDLGNSQYFGYIVRTRKPPPTQHYSPTLWRSQWSSD
ncbi:hypothetical protein AAMO2058_000252200 [Amorphochlora amoebiformis]